MSNLSKFFSELGKKTTQKRKRHGGIIPPLAILLGFFLSIYFTKTSVFYSPTEFLFIEGFLIAIFSYAFYIVGNLGLLLWAFSELSYPPVQGRYAKFKRIVKIFVTLPNPEQLLRVFRLLNDMLEKNGFDDYLSTTEFMKNVYNRLDTQEQEIAHLKSIIEDKKKEQDQILVDNIHVHNNKENTKSVDIDEKFE